MFHSNGLLRHIVLAVVFFFSFQIIAIPQAYAHCPSHSGQYGGDSDASSAPENQDNSNQESPNNPGHAAEPVYLSTGEFVRTETDLSFPCRGFSIKLQRTYRSQKAYNGRYGYGWFFNYDIRVKKLSNNNLVLLDGKGKRDEFVFNSEDGSYTSPPGFYDIIEQNEDGTYTRTLCHGTKYHFDSNGCLTRIEDRNGNSLAFTYDPAGMLPLIGTSTLFVDQIEGIVARDYRLTKIADPVGREINLAYNEKGRLASITDWAGRTFFYAYDEKYNLTSVTTPSTGQYPEGLTKTYTYYDNHKFKSITDPKGQTYLTNEYDDQGRVSIQTYGNGVFTFTYDTDNNKVSLINRKGYTTDYFLNDTGNIVQKVLYAGGLRETDPLSYITSHEYNSNMEITKTTYPLGNSVEFTYDKTNEDPRSRGNLLEIRRKPLPGEQGVFDIVTTLSYESRYNFIKTMTDPRGNVSAYIYDYEDPAYGVESGNLMKIIYPRADQQNIETGITYTEHGQIETTIDPNDIVTRYDYHTEGYLSKVINDYGDATHLNETSEMDYDSSGNLVSLKDPRDNATSFSYDNLNQLIQKTGAAPFNYIARYYYDRNGNLEQVSKQTVEGTPDIENPDHWQTIDFTHTILNKLKTFKDPLNRETTYNYDLNNNLESIVDANNNTTTYEYDERNLLFKIIDANTPQGITTYDYDANGNLKQIKDANGNMTAYVSDGFDRLITTRYADEKFSQYDHDKTSNLIRHTTPGTKPIEYDYDALNRMIAKRYPQNSGLNVSYSYDPGSRMVSADTAASQISFTYDKADRLKTTTQILNARSYTCTYNYDPAGNRTGIMYPSGKNAGYDYDSLNRFKNVKINGGVITEYGYDQLNRRIQKDYLTSNVQRTTYQYDIANQLEQIKNSVIGIGDISLYDYTYDAVGNRFTMTAPDGVHTYGYNAIYELTSVAGAQAHAFGYDKLGNRTVADAVIYDSNSLNQYKQVGSISFSYDQNGNLVHDGTNTYTFDEQNRVAAMQNGSYSATYEYDAFNRRVAKTVNGVNTYFIYDGNRVIAEHNSSGGLEAEYVYGDGIDEVLNMDRGGQTYFYHYDGLGSVTDITDASGTVIENYSYDVYGQPSTVESAIANPYMFTGRRFDPESGTYYYRARMYDQKIGRFLQRDPLGYLDGMNLYAYVQNNPAKWLDPFGLRGEYNPSVNWPDWMYDPNYNHYWPYTPPNHGYHKLYRSKTVGENLTDLWNFIKWFPQIPFWLAPLDDFINPKEIGPGDEIPEDQRPEIPPKDDPTGDPGPNDDPVDC